MKIINDKPKAPKILYSAIVLDEKSKATLLAAVGSQIPSDWDIFAHHMTILFGKGLPDDIKHLLGKEVELIATELGVSNMAIAVKVEGCSSKNDVPHVTIAVNTKEGGKPVMSNNIINWVPISPIILIGVVTEITTANG